MANFKVGDVVQLKSGGPAMTVAGRVPGASARLTCDWFDGKDMPHREVYAEEQLQTYKPPTLNIGVV